MSRIGKKTISIPSNVQIDFDSVNKNIKVKGSLGELKKILHNCITISIQDNELNVGVKDEDDKFQRAIWGTTRAIIYNLVEGVTKGFERKIELNGVGYKMELSDKALTAYIGFSHPVVIEIPSGIKLTLNKNLLTGYAINNEEIGNFFSSLHNLKPCDPYKQKGFKFPGRFYRKKVVKKNK
jgi:large subunit ribosomal protein L6